MSYNASLPSDRPQPERMPWFRTYRSDRHDVMLQRLPLALFKTAINLRTLAEHMSGRLPDIAQAAFELRLSEEKLRKSIDSLVSARFLRRDADAVFIENWHQCESDDAAYRKRNQRLTGKCPATRTETEDGTRLATPTETCPGPVTGKKRREEEENRESLSGSEPPAPPNIMRRTRLTEDAQPGERDRRAAANAQLSDVDFRNEWVRFRDFHVSKGSVMANWNAAWRTWLGNRKTMSFGGGGALRGHESNFTKAARELLGEIEDSTHDPGAYEPHRASRKTSSPPLLDLEPIRTERRDSECFH